MIGFTFSIIFLIVVLLGYFNAVKMSKREKEIRRNKLDYECFECHAKIDVNERKCPECSFVTLYGKRRSKFFIIFPILIIWFFLLVKWNKFGIFV
jgi:predicted nucleic acid-binding Zn ribbon protein